MSYPLVINTIAVGNKPQGISSDGNYVWVANYRSNNVSKININSGLVTTISLPQGSYGPFSISSYGNYVWVANYDTNNVSQIDKSSGSVINTIAVGTTPYSISSDGTYVWVANSGSSTVSQIDKSSGSVINTITVGYSPHGISSDGTYVWVANTDSTVSQIRISSSSVINTIAVGTNASPEGISSDGTYVWVANTGNNTVSQIRISNGSVINTIALGTTPKSISSDGTYVWVANYNNNVSQIQISSGSVINTIAVGNTPKSISSDGTYVWVANYNNDNVSQIQIQNSNSLTCFKEDSLILTDKGYIKIQDLRPGHLVKTISSGFKPIHSIGKRKIYHAASKERIKDQLYLCSKEKYPDLFEDLVITGCHSILVPQFKNDEEREKTIEVNGKSYVTDGHYRLPACADDRTSVYSEAGNWTIYHIALDNNDYYMNYGVYANGLLVETCSKRYLNEISGMELLE